MTYRMMTVYTLVGTHGVKPIHHTTPIPTTLTDTSQTGGAKNTYTAVVCSATIATTKQYLYNSVYI